MSRWGMVIDLDKCVGCQACSVACKEENNVPHGSPDEQKWRREIYWHKVIAATRGHYPQVSTQIIPMPCMHCDHAPCVTVCPAKATYRREDGIVIQNFRRCLGCKYCMVACPYGARSFNYKEQEEQSTNVMIRLLTGACGDSGPTLPGPTESWRNVLFVFTGSTKD